MNLENKRAQLCSLYFLPVTAAVIDNYPGANYIRIKGDWTKISIASGEFKEKHLPGDIIEQELKAVVPDTGVSHLNKMERLFINDGLIRIRMTNGDDKVVGTDQFPVRVTLENSGSPAKLTLSFKRESPELAKVFKSF